MFVPLDTMLDVPWSKSAKINCDLKKAKEILDEDHYGLKEVKENIEYLAVQKKLLRESTSVVFCWTARVEKHR